MLKDQEGRESKVTISLKFIPIKMKLDPSESVNNQGNLRVEVIDASNLPSADRNGFSDPFCKFYLQGKDIFKTKVQKKTLNPVWNEFFELPIRSRTAAEFSVDVWDWDLGGADDFLGRTSINLDMLEPFRKQEVTLTLDGKSGSIRLSMLFKPDYVTRSRQGSSTFHGTFSAPGKIASAPLKTVGRAGSAVGSGAKSATRLGQGLFGRSRGSNEASPTVNGDTNGTSPVIANEHERPVEGSPVAGADVYSTKDLPATPSKAGAGGDGGTATISVVSASGFPVGTKVQVLVLHETTKKEVLKTKPIKNKAGDVSWEEEKQLETRKIVTTADTAFRVVVHDHSTFGSDHDLGSATFFIDDQGSGGEKTVSVGAGSVVIRSSFEPMAAQKQADAASIVSASSPAHKTLRKSFIGRRGERERSATPG